MYTSLTAVWLLASSVWMGGAACFFALHPYLSVLECAAAAAPIGLTLSTWLGVLFKSYLFASSDGLTPGLGLTVCCVQSALAAAVTQRILLRWDKRTARTAAVLLGRLALPLACVVLPLALWFAFIHYTHSLLPANDVYNVGGTVYGDMPFHLMIINSLLFGVNVHAAPLAGVPLKAAFFTDADLVYPYIPDYHTAMVAGAGSTLHFALFSAGTLLCASFVALLFFLALRLTSSVVAASLAVPLALFCGGTGAFTWLLRDTSWAGLRAVDHILEDSVSREITICWFSLPAHILLPQRTTQFAYPVAILAVIIMYRAYQAYQDQRSATALSPARGLSPASEDVLEVPWAACSRQQKLCLFAAGGFVTGLLPQLQAHSFVSVGIVMLVVAGIQFVRCLLGGGRPSEMKEIVQAWTVYGVCAFSIGLPQSLMYFGKVSNPGQSFIRFLPIWMDFPEGNPLLLWFHAVGFFVPLHFSALALLPMSASHRLFQYGFAAVFVVGNVVIFQPWVLDNTKVFYVWVFGAASAVAVALEHFWKRGDLASKSGMLRRSSNPLLDTSPSLDVPPGLKARLWKAAAVTLFVSLIFSGVLCCFNESLSFNRLYDKSDMEVALWFQENTAPDARVAISTTIYSQHMRPSAALAGRQIMSSYWGWISNHGMPNYEGRNFDMINLLSGQGDGRELLLNYNVTHIVVDRFHMGDFDMQFINAMSYRVAENSKFFIYEVAPYEALVNIVDCIPPHAPAHSGGVDPEECEAHGCMWRPNANLDPFCQVPPVQWARTDPPEDCMRGSKDTCNHGGCSWFEGFQGPYCQLPLGVPGRNAMPIVRQPNGNDCGWAGMRQEQCESRGCHWRPDSPGPWCQLDGPPIFEHSAFNSIHALI